MAGFVAGATAMVGCGGAADLSRPAAPSGAPADEDSSLAELDRAEAELNRAFGGVKKETAPKSPDATPLSEPPGDSCETACRALGSMERAATHICELAGEGEARCTGAKDRVARATERVKGACPACATG